MNYFLLSLVIAFGSLQFASAQDIIVKHNGSKLEAKVNYVTESVVVYTSPGENSSGKLGKAEVEKIIYKSGRVELISQKIVVNGHDDWKKIVLTSNPLSVVGLIKKGEIKVKSGRESHGTASFDSKEVEKMKKQAADMGAHVILVNGYDGRIEPSEHNKMEVVVAYGY
ncbi:hypothetical protein [Dyadobacter diqingensis]|uniref:hypothetical protein n=1 Tax=Dyadobacter diqingensis TaxID=2938121 RepID=UPI0020C1B61B|nr:hypothetical protein [Dyadobacter diqingensis]